METKSVLLRAAILLIVAFVLFASFSLTPPPVSAETYLPATFTPPQLNQGGTTEGWDAFWAQFKIWLEQLALVFAEMPLLGPVLAEILRFIGAANVWFCGAVLFIIFILGIARR